MEPDDFDLHIHAEATIVNYYNSNLKQAIDSFSVEEKVYLEKSIEDVSKKFGRQIKLSFGFVYGDKNIENVLSHIDLGDRQSLDLVEPEGIERGYLKYRGHNLTNDKVEAPAYSIILKYISLLNERMIEGT